MTITRKNDRRHPEIEDKRVTARTRFDYHNGWILTRFLAFLVGPVFSKSPFELMFVLLYSSLFSSSADFVALNKRESEIVLAIPSFLE